MTPTKLNRAPLTKRISALAITTAAALTLAAFSMNAHAATPAKPTKEFNALVAKLPAGVTIDTATPAQLAQAVTAAASDPANAKLKDGNIAGEALKYGGNQTAGDEIGTALINLNPSAATLAARDAIKRAGSGKGLNVSMVPDFAAQFVATNAEALALAKLVISTKPGAGAVIGGRAGELLTFAEQTALTNEALAKTAKLTAATTDILKYVVAEVDEDAGGAGATALFTTQIASTNAALAAKIGTGGVAGDPTNGGNIVDALLTADLPKLKSGIASFAKSVGNVADIEEISKIAFHIGDQIGTPSTSKPTTTAIKFSAANGVVKSLAKAIVAKATTSSAPTNPNSVKNKQDEIAEVAAAMVAKILNPLTVQGTGGGKPQVTIKNAGAKIFAIVLSAVNATKPKKVQAANPGIYAETAEDVAGSVAETLSSLRNAPGSVILPEFYDAIKAFLVKKANTIGGKANATAVLAAINNAYEDGGVSLPDTAYEDGTLAGAPANLVLTSDYPETDFRPN